MKRYLQIFASILIALALLLILRASYAIYDWQQRTQVYEMTQGIVTEIAANADSTQFFPIISFKAIDNQKLTIRSRLPDVSVALGDTVQVIYDLANPDDMMLVHLHPSQKSKLWMTEAALLLSIGGFILLVQHSKQRRCQLLQNMGKTLEATYQQTQTFSLLGIRFYRAILVAKIEYPQVQELHFISDWFVEDPAPYWQEKQVKVHVHLTRENDYWVNTELLPARILLV
ncbi:MAG: hypothetical protein RMJ87_12680 [Cytophagales bacterium]|nr:DUF3592 domain-containing protein [Bernardetiaceae bacterium]MDW8205876.1 hypothetical protein [Cytophagales bacterium]